MVMRAIVILAAAALASGCGKPAEQQPARPEIKVRGAAQDRVHKLDELNRAIGLKRAIQDAGSTCQRVTATRFIGPYKNMDMWGVRCADGRDWALFVGADDSVQVRLCSDTEKVGLPDCKLGDLPAKSAG